MMQYESKTIGAKVEILNRDGFEGIPVTLDFSAVTDLEDGRKIVKAGTPIGNAGVVDNTGTAKGILLWDVYEDRPVGTILKKAYIKTAVAQKHSGVTIAAEAKAALPMVVFE